jgi:hypothetical protein
MNIFVQNTVKELSDIPDLTGCARLTINNLVLHSRFGKTILTQPCYEMQLKMRGSLSSTRSRLPQFAMFPPSIIFVFLPVLFCPHLDFLSSNLDS